MSKRDLTTADVAAVMALVAASKEARPVYKAVEKLALETCGYAFITVLKYDEARRVVERVSSSNEKAYPVGGTKPLDKITTSHSAMEQGEIFLAADREAVKKAFFDHELIFSLGATAIMNVPIRHAGRRLGTLNFSGLEGTYGEREKAIGKVLAGLLVPSLIEATRG